MPEYFDTHSHVHFPEFDADRDAVLSRMREKNVWTIAVGVGLETSKGAVEIAGSNADIWATIGVHPTDTDEGFNGEEYEKLLTERVVAIGECGLDYYRTPREGIFERQKEVFEAQIAFAAEHNLPLMLHVRPSKGSDDAHDDALKLLLAAREKYGDAVRGNAHFFTGSLMSAKRYWALGFTTAFPGVITFAKECEEVVREAPGELILSETDAPYASPVPHRGERNQPAYVIDTAEAIARIRGEDLEILKKRLVSNAFRVFGIKI